MDSATRLLLERQRDLLVVEAPPLRGTSGRTIPAPQSSSDPIAPTAPASRRRNMLSAMGKRTTAADEAWERIRQARAAAEAAADLAIAAMPNASVENTGASEGAWLADIRRIRDAARRSLQAAVDARLEDSRASDTAVATAGTMAAASITEFYEAFAEFQAVALRLAGALVNEMRFREALALLSPMVGLAANPSLSASIRDQMAVIYPSLIVSAAKQTDLTDAQQLIADAKAVGADNKDWTRKLGHAVHTRASEAGPESMLSVTRLSGALGRPAPSHLAALETALDSRLSGQWQTAWTATFDDALPQARAWGTSPDLAFASPPVFSPDADLVCFAYLIRSTRVGEYREVGIPVLAVATGRIVTHASRSEFWRSGDLEGDPVDVGFDQFGDAYFLATWARISSAEGWRRLQYDEQPPESDAFRPTDAADQVSAVVVRVLQRLGSDGGATHAVVAPDLSAIACIRLNFPSNADYSPNPGGKVPSLAVWLLRR